MPAIPVYDSNELIMTERRKLPTTKDMVQHILLENDSRKGISLRRIYECIKEKYTIEITARRKSLTKKYVTDLISENMLINVTGRGLTGSLRLANKKKFLQDLKPQNVSVKRNNGKKPTKGKGAHRPDNESSDNEEVEEQQQQSESSSTINTEKRNTRNAKKIKSSKRKRDHKDNRDDDEEEVEEQQQQQQSESSSTINSDKRNTRNAKKIKSSKRKRDHQDNRDDEEEEEQQQQQQTISIFDTPLEHDRPTTSTPYSLWNKVAPTAPVRKNRTKKKTPPISYIETPRASGRQKKFKPMEQIDERIY